MENIKERPIKKSKVSRIKTAKLRKAYNKNRKNISIKDIESILGFDHSRPIVLTNADMQDTLEKDDKFKDWYEEKLRGLYEEFK